jgi:acetyl-CoA carboxylase carboxyltransferase component
LIDKYMRKDGEDDQRRKERKKEREREKKKERKRIAQLIGEGTRNERDRKRRSREDTEES